MNNESKALTEVWEWKEAAYREVEHLDIREALRIRLYDSIATVKKLGFDTTHPAEHAVKKSA